MASSVFSSSWYRVAELRPQLRTHAHMHRHQYRGRIWYVLEDLSADRYYRFTPAAYTVIGLMDGTRTVQEVWEQSSAELAEEAPTQDEVIQLLSQLHRADALHSDVTPDTRELLERADLIRKGKLSGQLMSPLFWKIPLFDPERLLDRFMPVARALTSWPMVVVWFVVVFSAAVQAATHWNDITGNLSDRVLAPDNLLLLWLLFPFIKALHEFGHAFATKLFGGEVHEMGIMMIVLTPLPYVDASSASAFRTRRQRVLVGAAGMIVEVFIASLALFVWLNVEDGLLRMLAYNTFFIGSISTLLFNANPLLRFDGYYILSDLIEIPNMRQRSTRWLAYLGERWILGNADAMAPHGSTGEKTWFVFYGIAAAIYRVFIVTSIVLFVAQRFFFIGVVLALWTLVGWVVVPLVRGIKSLLSAPRLRRVRSRTVGAVVGGALLIVTLTCFVPVPLNSRAEGVIWVPDNCIVRAATDGFIQTIVAEPGAWIEPGDTLFVTVDPELETRVAALEAAVRQRQAEYDAIWFEDPVEADVIKQEKAFVEASLQRARDDLQALVIRSEVAGTFVAPDVEDMQDMLVQRGSPAARVIDLSTLTVRVVVSQADIDLIRQRTVNVDVRAAERLDRILRAEIVREVPGGSDQLPTMALGLAGGGEIAVDPMDSRGTRALQKFFQFDLRLPSDSDVVNVGGRVFVRFHHGWEPVAFRWGRSLRRLMLSRFGI
jgi:putative peptide zinc metalloprotease protein